MVASFGAYRLGCAAAGVDSKVPGSPSLEAALRYAFE
jgi:hypothetical protein